MTGRSSFTSWEVTMEDNTGWCRPSTIEIKEKENDDKMICAYPFLTKEKSDDEEVSTTPIIKIKSEKSDDETILTSPTIKIN